MLRELNGPQVGAPFFGLIFENLNVDGVLFQLAFQRGAGNLQDVAGFAFVAARDAQHFFNVQCFHVI